MKDTLEVLKYTLLIIVALSLYSLSLESINAYKADKAQCDSSPENKHDAVDSDEELIALITKSRNY